MSTWMKRSITIRLYVLKTLLTFVGVDGGVPRRGAPRRRRQRVGKLTISFTKARKSGGPQSRGEAGGEVVAIEGGRASGMDGALFAVKRLEDDGGARGRG